MGKKKKPMKFFLNTFTSYKKTDKKTFLSKNQVYLDLPVITNKEKFGKKTNLRYLLILKKYVF